jgi:catalase
MAEVEPPALSKGNALTRVVFIGLALAAMIGTLAYLRGWLTPHALTPARFVDAFEQADGRHPGFRRNHAKGVNVTGYFESNGAGARLSKAGVFETGRVPVVGRFSLGGGHPDMPDAPAAVRGLGLQFALSDGELWRTAMINLPVFPLPTPEAFHERLVASKPDPKTGKPDPDAMKAFLARHPETVQATKVIQSQPIASGFANSTFHGLSAFQFINAAGVSTPVRWQLIPEQPFVAASGDANDKAKNYLFDGLINEIHRQPLRWRLLVIVGQPGDATNDASKAWPAEREHIDVGLLTLDKIESDDSGPATYLNFDPLVLPAGIAPSDDPLLSARSAVYSQSYTRRVGEKQQSAVISPADVEKKKAPMGK